MEVQDAPEHLPSRVIFELIELCNYDCVHCFVPHRERGPDTETAVEVASKVVEAGVPSVSWTGGEPFLRDDLFEIMESLPEGDTVHTINTNGSLLDEDDVERTAEHFSLVRVSIYGNEESFERNTGGVRQFDYETSMTAISRFLDMGLPVQVNVPAISPDPAELKEIALDITDRFGDSLEEVVFIPVINVGPTEDREYPSREEIRGVIEPIEDRIESPIRYFEWKPGKHMVIKADMHAYAHPIDGTELGGKQIGSAVDESIEALWERFPPEFRNAHRSLTPSVDDFRQ